MRAMNICEYLFWKIMNLISCMDYIKYITSIFNLRTDNEFQVFSKKPKEEKDSLKSEKQRCEDVINKFSSFIDEDLYSSGLDSLKCMNSSRKLGQFLTRNFIFKSAVGAESDSYDHLVTKAVSTHKTHLNHVQTNWEMYKKLFKFNVELPENPLKLAGMKYKKEDLEDKKNFNILPSSAYSA